jgi:hypothetical protein
MPLLWSTCYWTHTPHKQINQVRPPVTCLYGDSGNSHLAVFVMPHVLCLAGASVLQ